MNRLIPSIVLQCLALLTLSACSEKSSNSEAESDKASTTPATNEEIVGVASAALTPSDLIRYSRAALEGDGQKAFLVMIHYQMAEHDYRNAEYWALISAENGHLDGVISYAGYLLDIPASDRCYRAQFWVRRAQAIAGNQDDSMLKTTEEKLAQKCLGML